MLPYFPASFLVISSTIFGRRSAITLSTMLAMVLASVADGKLEPFAAGAAIALGASSGPLSTGSMFSPAARFDGVEGADIISVLGSRAGASLALLSEARSTEASAIES